MKQIYNRAKFDTFVKTGMKIVDLRDPISFRDGHVKGAENIPLNRFLARIQLIYQNNKEILLYSDSQEDFGTIKQYITNLGLIWDGVLFYNPKCAKVRASGHKEKARRPLPRHKHRKRKPSSGLGHGRGRKK